MCGSTFRTCWEFLWWLEEGSCLPYDIPFEGIEEVEKLRKTVFTLGCNLIIYACLFSHTVTYLCIPFLWLEFDNRLVHGRIYFYVDMPKWRCLDWRVRPTALWLKGTDPNFNCSQGELNQTKGGNFPVVVLVVHQCITHSDWWFLLPTTTVTNNGDETLQDDKPKWNQNSQS